MDSSSQRGRAALGMSPVRISSVQGEEINSLEDWFRLAPPKQKSAHWSDGRSAKELARLWTSSVPSEVPDVVATILRSHPEIENLTIESAIPEVVTRLDNLRGGHRNHDLILLGETEKKSVLIAIEAKADEPFGKTIQNYLTSLKPGSMAGERIQKLSHAIFGRSIDSELRKLRYQLFHAVAGTLIEAKKREADIAIFLVHEFITPKTKCMLIERNAEDFQMFIHTFPELRTELIKYGSLLGPVKVRGGSFVPDSIPLLIGKIQTEAYGVPPSG
jgi:hypothetical protein